LATEAAAAEKLVQKLNIRIPELLEISGQIHSHRIAFERLTRRFEIAA